MNSLLEAIHSGEILPFAELDMNSDEYKQAACELCDVESEILTRFPECKPLLEKYQFAQMRVDSIALFRHFQNGFRAGAQLMLEAMEPIE